MRLKDFSVLNPQYKGENTDAEVSFVPMESLRNGTIDYQDIPFKEAKGKYTYFSDGDLLVAKVTPCFENGNIAIANKMKEGIGFGSSEIFVLRMDKKVLNTYMFYVTQSGKFQDGACATMCGVGGLKRISPLFMRTYELDIPSLSEQQLIVDYLDEKLSNIEKRIAILEKQRNAYARLKKSIVHQAVTRGLNPNVPLKDSGIEWIGMIPEHWEGRRLKDFSVLNPRFTGQEKRKEVSFLPMEGLRYDSITLQSISFEEGKSKYTFFAEGDLLMAKVTPCFENGNIAIATDLKEGIGFGSSEIFVLRLDRSVSSRYFFYYIQAPSFQDEACSTMCGVGGLKRISPIFMRICAVFLPPLSEQQAIANYLDEKCAKIDASIDNIGKQIDALKRLKRALINEVITGQRAI